MEVKTHLFVLNKLLKPVVRSEAQGARPHGVNANKEMSNNNNLPKIRADPPPWITLSITYGLQRMKITGAFEVQLTSGARLRRDLQPFVSHIIRVPVRFGADIPDDSSFSDFFD
ncbi:unnamed protein product [Nesidiocoris tenuis]|uniref:Uncharacterized protein n=1 Tax=Nesidiocoris tenuis TaxID=355587 RepID=A0A6H5GQ47_9HEMI|nr:unnamed protein product [Nesidiocoris tenuis]